jgi:hypothetical protein
MACQEAFREGSASAVSGSDALGRNFLQGDAVLDGYTANLSVDCEVFSTKWM